MFLLSALALLVPDSRAVTRLCMHGRIFSLTLPPPPSGEGRLFNYLVRCCTMSLSA
jgi:hypothetical protein